MQAQLDAQTASYRLAHKFTVLDVRALDATTMRVYVDSEELPTTPETVVKWVEACGCEYARHGWDGVGGEYVDVRGGV